MSSNDPNRDLPVSLTGGSDLWDSIQAGVILQNDFFQSNPTASAGFKVWDGSAWVDAVLKRWDGSAWVNAPLRRWNGSSWITI